MEKAELAALVPAAEEMQEMIVVETPGTKTIEAVAQLLNLDVTRTIKAVAFQNEKDELICLLLSEAIMRSMM